MVSSMVIQRPEFNGLVLCRELRICVFADLAEAVDASEGKDGCPLNDEFADKLLDSVSPVETPSCATDGELKLRKSTPFSTLEEAKEVPVSGRIDTTCSCWAEGC
jgi:hypothetical protein